MNLRYPPPRSPRRGAVLPLVVILLIFLFGMVAFAVDTGYIVQTRLELQNAADSAALAGAARLLDLQLEATFTPVLDQDALRAAFIKKARDEAKKFGELNKGGGVSLALNEADITVGYLDSPAWQSTFQLTPLDTQPLNSVQVAVRRDQTVKTGALALFFAPLIGTKTADVRADATATYQGGNTITGFNSPSNGPNNLLLPIAVDYTLWTTFLQTGLSPNGQKYDAYTAKRPTGDLSAPNNVSTGADQIPEFAEVYPNTTSPGNFGLVSIGPGANDTPAYRDWIAHGSSPSDMRHFGPNGIQASLTNPARMKGGPGLKSTLVTDLQAIIGQTRIIPLYSTYGGNGSNTYYDIVGFAGVTIVKAEGHGSNIDIRVQPISVVDRTATTGSASVNNVSRFVYRPLSLTR